MASGTLPIQAYHRAAQVGSGTYGTVIVVYNNDGEEFALKLFLEDEDSEDDSGIDIGAFREISILRLLRDRNSHPNIIEIADLKDFDSCEESAGIPDNCLGIVMPLFNHGTLADALDQNILIEKKDKVSVAHGLLSAIATLHENGIIHRDIKSDNVMLDYVETKSSNNTKSCWKPILIDFSLAKVIGGSMYRSIQFSEEISFLEEESSTTHTPTVGTVTYIAPEVVLSQPYSFPSDLWSVGVILLEMIQNHTIQAEKNKEALRMIEEMKSKLPNQPFPNLIRGLLNVDPKERLTAHEALRSPLFQKYGFKISGIPTSPLLDIREALPIEYNDEGGLFCSITRTDSSTKISTQSNNQRHGLSKKRIRRKEAREDKIIRLCTELGFKNPMTPIAANCYAKQLYQEIDDTIDNLMESQGLLDCVILSYRFFELEVLSLPELNKTMDSFSSWDLNEYLDTENTLFVLMDYCLLPR